MKRLGFLLCLLLGTFPVWAQEEKISIWFDTGSYTLPDSSLWLLVKKIHQPGLVRIYIEGHCDSVGSVAYNLALSKKRAYSVKEFLMTNGIREANIKTCIGWGKSKPITLNNNEAARQQNRRVDITLYRATTPPAFRDSASRKLNGDSLLSIEKVRVGESIRLKNLYFEPGRHKIKEASMPELIRLLRTMSHYPKLRIELQGYVCCAAEDADGFDWDTETETLSVNRAQAVAEFLIEQGISAKRLVVKGFGGANKISPDEREEENRALNRRVECKILNK